MCFCIHGLTARSNTYYSKILIKTRFWEANRGAQRTGSEVGVTKRRRLSRKSSGQDATIFSYARSWRQYIDGRVVSCIARRYINNFLAATAARVVEKDSDEDASSGSSCGEDFRTHAGNMQLVRDTLVGIARRDGDEGSLGYGRYNSCIQLGRALWETPALSEPERAAIRREPRAKFLPSEEAIRAARETAKMEEERKSPFASHQDPWTHLSLEEYGSRIADWLMQVQKQAEETPTKEQLRVLEAVATRVLREVEHEKLGATAAHDDVEPLRGLVHGVPGTGKSRVIALLRSFFQDALGWKHGSEFLCVAFQNRMAAAIGGVTLHAGADLPRPGENRDRKLEHSDVDNLYARHGRLRWIIMDEVSMISDELLGEFEAHITNAASATRYTRRRDKTQRIFGGYNLLLVGDFWQLPPIPDSGALFLPPIPERRSSFRARRVLNMFWSDDADSISFLQELTIQKRVEDTWFNSVLMECRQGSLRHESYCFLLGLPTEHCGTWVVQDGRGYNTCGVVECSTVPEIWRGMACRGDRLLDAFLGSLSPQVRHVRNYQKIISNRMKEHPGNRGGLKRMKA